MLGEREFVVRVNSHDYLVRGDENGDTESSRDKCPGCGRADTFVTYERGLENTTVWKITKGNEPYQRPLSATSQIGAEAVAEAEAELHTEGPALRECYHCGYRY